jgi:hypothetical protein
MPPDRGYDSGMAAAKKGTTQKKRTPAKPKRAPAKAEEPPVVVEPETKPEGRLSVTQQFERNVKIVLARHRGASYATVAQKHDLSVIQCKRIVKAFREANPTLRHQNPVEIVDEMLEGYMADLNDLNDVVEKAEHEAAKTGAINARRQVREKITELLQAVGALPHDLGTLRLEMDAQVTVRKVLTILERYKLPDEAFDEILTELGGPPPGFEDLGLPAGSQN